MANAVIMNKLKSEHKNGVMKKRVRNLRKQLHRLIMLKSYRQCFLILTLEVNAKEYKRNLLNSQEPHLTKHPKTKTNTRNPLPPTSKKSFQPRRRLRPCSKREKAKCYRNRWFQRIRDLPRKIELSKTKSETKRRRRRENKVVMRISLIIFWRNIKLSFSKR